MMIKPKFKRIIIQQLENNSHAPENKDVSDHKASLVVSHPISKFPELHAVVHSPNHFNMPVQMERHIPGVSDFQPINNFIYDNKDQIGGESDQMMMIGNKKMRNNKKVRIAKFIADPNTIHPSLKVDMDSLKKSFYFNPKELELLPEHYWGDQMISLSEAEQNFFSVRSSKKLRFEYKLFDALTITQKYSQAYDLVGIAWVTKLVFKVNRNIFGPFVGISNPSSSLFNGQGSMIRHGFKEIPLEEMENYQDNQLLSDVDNLVVRLFKHESEKFTWDSRGRDVAICRWKKP